MKTTFGTRCEAPDQGAEGDLADLLARLARLHLLARERLIRGEAHYRGAWKGRDNLAEAEEEAADMVNYTVFALAKAAVAVRAVKVKAATPGPLATRHLSGRCKCC